MFQTILTQPISKKTNKPWNLLQSFVNRLYAVGVCVREFFFINWMSHGNHKIFNLPSILLLFVTAHALVLSLWEKWMVAWCKWYLCGSVGKQEATRRRKKTPNAIQSHGKLDIVFDAVLMFTIYSDNIFCITDEWYWRAHTHTQNTRCLILQRTNFEFSSWCQ